MKPILGASLVCLIGVTACSHREPSDAQLTTLLSAGATGLDAKAVDCLRSLSNDVSLVRGLAPSYVDDSGKRNCTQSLTTRLDDAQRNPDKFSLAEVDAPPVVRRAMQLLSASRIAAVRAADAAVPAEMTAITPYKPEVDSSVDLGVAGAKLAEAESACQQVQSRAATSDDVRFKEYANFCGSTLKRTRTTMQIFAKRKDTARVDTLATTAENMTRSAQSLLASGK